MTLIIEGVNTQSFPRKRKKKNVHNTKVKHIVGIMVKLDEWCLLAEEKIYNKSLIYIIRKLQ